MSKVKVRGSLAREHQGADRGLAGACNRRQLGSRCREVEKSRRRDIPKLPAIRKL